MLIIIINSLVTHILSFKRWFDIGAKHEKLIDKIQALERPTNEMKKSLHTLTEEFRSEPTTPWYDKNEEEWPKVIRKPTLVYQVTI